jgi:hypothetical protein
MTATAQDAGGIVGLIRLLEFILHHEKGFKMTQIQLEVDIEVAAQSQLLQVTPNPASEDLTVGVDATGTAVATVTGGVPPYGYALDPASPPMPDGVSFMEDGNGNITLSGTPTTATNGSVAVLLDITDSSTQQAAKGKSAAVKLNVKPAPKKIA